MFNGWVGIMGLEGSNSNSNPRKWILDEGYVDLRLIFR